MEKPRQRLLASHRPSGLESDAQRRADTDESRARYPALQPLAQIPLSQ